METIDISMSPKEIRVAGMNALAQKLGIVGMIRFLQDSDTGHGDYTKDRHEWLGNPDIDEIIGEISETKNK